VRSAPGQRLAWAFCLNERLTSGGSCPVLELIEAGMFERVTAAIR
jgi:hypothetical protein